MKEQRDASDAVLPNLAGFMRGKRAWARTRASAATTGATP